MPGRNKCCNPFKKDKHNRKFNSLRQVSVKWGSNFKKLVGKYICDVCRKEVKSKNISEMAQDETENRLLIDESEYDDENRDLSFRAPYESDQKPLKKLECAEANNIADEIKLALSKQTNKYKKLEILSTVPAHWSIRQIRNKCNVCFNMARVSKKIRHTSGYCTSAQRKKGRKLLSAVVKQIEDFYQSDDCCRIMPGKKDCVSIVVNGKRKLVQKRLLLGDLKELYKRFCAKYPVMKVSISLFTKLRPRFCVPVGPSGSHTVCVCKIHKNMDFKICAINQAILHAKRNLSTYSLETILDSLVCKEPKPQCYLLNCQECPGPSATCEDITLLCQNNGISNISYKQWTSTDRCQLVTFNETPEELSKKLELEIPAYLKHHYIAKTQTAFYNSVKENLKHGEYLIALDFAENYTFRIQDAVQSYHWTNDQATVHPYVIYYIDSEGLINHKNFVIISECNKHDAVAVYLFNRHMINFLKTKFGPDNVMKLFFFSDGAGSQYKNKSNLINLAYFKRDFNLDVEWHFFATSHGKGPCDGLGGTVKRQASRVSSQRTITNHITNAKELYEWAVGFFKNISFGYNTDNDYNNEQTFLKTRFETAKVIRNTRKYHSFVPQDNCNILCRETSFLKEFIKNIICQN